MSRKPPADNKFFHSGTMSAATAQNVQKTLSHMVPLALTAFLLFCTFPCSAGAQAPSSWSKVRLEGHVSSAVNLASKLPRRPEADNELITFSVDLNLSDRAGLDNFASAIRDPHSPDFRRAITTEEVTKRFGPTQEVYNSVLKFLDDEGFEIVQGSVNRMTIAVRGTRLQIERTFNVSINDYKLNGVTFRANDGNPEVPAALAPYISAVSGLSNANRPVPAQLGAPSPATISSITTAYYAGGFPNLNGSGQVIGLVEFSSFNMSDLQNSLAENNLPASLVNQVSTYIIGTNAPSVSSNGEVIGDIMSALGTAPGATITVMEVDPNLSSYSTIFSLAIAHVQSMQTGGVGGTISYSYAGCEDPSLSAIDNAVQSILYTATTASNLSFFVAAGDNGNGCVNSGTVTPNNINFPANLPSAVAVGGTTLNVVQATNAYSSESWLTGLSCSFGTCAGGYGLSQVFGRPGWQNASNPYAWRSVPDVSLDANPNTAFNICNGVVSGSPSCGSFGGTSMAAPIWAGIWALVSQGLTADPTCGQPCTAGAGNGLLYEYAGYYPSPSNPSCSLIFHSGPCMTGTGNDFEHVGLGSVNISNLISALTNAPYIGSISPASGPITGGTSVTITGFLLYAGRTNFTFGAGTAQASSCTGITTCTLTTPSGAYGSVQVFAINPFEPTHPYLGFSSPSNPAITFFYYLIFYRLPTPTPCTHLPCVL